MTRHARGSDGWLTALRNRIEPTIDLLDHTHHLPRDDLVALRVAGEIELGKRLPFAANVTELTANAESAREVAHGTYHVGHGRRVWKDLCVDQRVRWKLARKLRRGDRCNTEDEDDGKESHRCSVETCS